MNKKTEYYDGFWISYKPNEDYSIEIRVMSNMMSKPLKEKLL